MQVTFHRQIFIITCNNSLTACRLAEIVANKLRLEEKARSQQRDEEVSQQLSESARAVRDSSVLQQMASQINKAPQQVRTISACTYLPPHIWLQQVNSLFASG